MKSRVRSRAAVLLCWLAIAVIAGGYCAARFAGSAPLQTDLLALLPATESDAVAERAVGELAGAMGDRVFFVLASPDAARTKAAARAFGQSLARDGALTHVIAELPPFDLSSIAAFYLPYRFGLLSQDDRAQLDGGAPSPGALLARRLNAPLHAGIATPLGDDPFGWLEHFLADLPLANANVTVEDNMLIARQGAKTDVIVTASLPASAYEQATQRAVRDTLERASARLRRDYPGVELHRAGAVFYADAARRRAEREVHLIGAVSALGIALIMLWVFRSVKLVALGFLSTALGVLCALAATLAMFGKLHLLTLVFGASLIGEAVDYSIQLFVAHLAMGPRWRSRKGVRIVRGGLTVALSTSLFGYAMLAAVPFPALAQIACFAIVGVGTAYASVLWLLPALLSRPSRHASGQRFERASRMLDRWRLALAGRRGVIVAALLVIACVPGWLSLGSDDDIHLLVRRDASLAADERVIREAVGFEGGSQSSVRGADDETVLQRAEALVARLEADIEQGGLRSVQSVTQFVPSARTQRDNRRLLDARVLTSEFALRTSLVAAGFRDDVARRYLAAHRDAATALTVDAWLRAPVSAPYRHLWLGHVPEGGAAAIVLPAGLAGHAVSDMRALARQLPGTTFVDKAASVSSAFGMYRRNAGLWLAAALGVVLASLAWRYGMRGACAVTAPVALAIGAALALFGYLHVPLNLFHWLALMLVLCVGSNYAVFLREGMTREASARAHGGAVWTGVLLSAATALLSFGTLSLSSMPALQSFGMTLAAGIALAALLAPMGLDASAGHRHADNGEAR